MSSLTKTNPSIFAIEENKTNSSLSSFWEWAEQNRIGMAIMVFTIVACAGGLTAAFGAGGNLVSISIIAFSTVLVETMVLGVVPTRVIVWVSIPALVIDLLVLLF